MSIKSFLSRKDSYFSFFFFFFFCSFAKRAFGSASPFFLHLPQHTAMLIFDSFPALLPLNAHFPSAALATLAAYAVGSFSNFATHLPQQNLATSSTVFEPSAALPLIGHLSLIASAAFADPIEIETKPMRVIEDLISDFIHVREIVTDVLSQMTFSNES